MRVGGILGPALAFPLAFLIASGADAHPLLPGVVVVVGPGLEMDAIVMDAKGAFAAIMRYRAISWLRHPQSCDGIDRFPRTRLLQAVGAEQENVVITIFAVILVHGRRCQQHRGNEEKRTSQNPNFHKNSLEIHTKPILPYEIRLRYCRLLKSPLARRQATTLTRPQHGPDLTVHIGRRKATFGNAAPV